MRKFLIVMILVMSASTAQAAMIHASVKGLVCAFCATGIEKSFNKRAEVEKVNVDLDAKMVTVVTKPNKDLDDATVTKLINDAGISVTKIERMK